MIHIFCSDMAFKGGGYLSFEDAQGNTRSTLLEKGFLDFLNQVQMLNVLFFVLSSYKHVRT